MNFKNHPLTPTITHLIKLGLVEVSWGLSIRPLPQYKVRKSSFGIIQHFKTPVSANYFGWKYAQQGFQIVNSHLPIVKCNACSFPLIISNAEKHGNQIAAMPGRIAKKCNSRFSAPAEIGIVPTSGEFRAIPRKGQFIPLQFEDISPSTEAKCFLDFCTHITKLKSKIVPDGSLKDRKGTKKALIATTSINAEVPYEMLQSFKSCRGHHSRSRKVHASLTPRANPVILAIVHP